MRPNQISLETAKKLAEALKMPIEHVMHTPPHILMKKLAELEKEKKMKKNSSGEKVSVRTGTFLVQEMV